MVTKVPDGPTDDYYNCYGAQYCSHDHLYLIGEYFSYPPERAGNLSVSFEIYKVAEVS